MTRKSVVIIKHGYSETCDSSISTEVSLGDVFRCTCLLEAYRGAHVTWITAHKASQLLDNNHLIDRLILADTPDFVPNDLYNTSYSEVINLEKQADWCKFTAKLKAKKHFGFKTPPPGQPEDYYPESAEALKEALYGNYFHPYQDILFKIIGRQWTGQHYVLGYHPKVLPIYDIGLNHHVGPKWPVKHWPKSNWNELYEQLSQQYSVSWQQSLNSIHHYIDWLASCRLIITCDSLGLHLGLGLNRKLIALFGPTPAEQVYMYGQGFKLTPTTEHQCIPCFQPECSKGRTCMEDITVEAVLEAVTSLLIPADILNNQKNRIKHPLPL